MPKKFNEWNQSFGPVSNSIVNFWFAEIGLGRSAVLLFVAHRTLRWSKQWEFIPYAHFTDGIPAGSDGIVYHTGIGIKRAQLSIFIADLEERNLLIVDRSKVATPLSHRGMRYSLNIQNIVTPLGLGVDYYGV